MKISTEINSLGRLVGHEKAVEYCAKAGFDAWDFSLFNMIDYDKKQKILLPSSHPLAGNDYLKYARRLKKIGEDNGIVCNQSHAPFRYLNLENGLDFFKRALECTAEAGGEICVIHALKDKTPQENAEFYMELLPFAKQVGVKIAVENLVGRIAETKEAKLGATSTPELLCGVLDYANDDSLVACLDIGHANQLGVGIVDTDLVYALKNKLCALHIHDNDLHRDLHLIPGAGKIDYDRFLKALKDIGYKGYLTLEAISHREHFTPDTAFTCAKELAASARKLADRFEEI